MARHVNFRDSIDARVVTQILISNLHIDDPHVYSGPENKPGLEVFSGIDVRDRKFGVYFNGKTITKYTDGSPCPIHCSSYVIESGSVKIPDRMFKQLKATLNGNPDRELTAIFLLDEE